MMARWLRAETPARASREATARRPEKRSWHRRTP
nr:MAG TPA: hypothetical protein [Caudoviricetes sp.]